MSTRLSMATRQSHVQEMSLPIRPRGVGHLMIEHGWHQVRTARQSVFVVVAWVIAGELRLVFNGENHDLKAGDVYYFLPREAHDTVVLSQRAEMRWLTFDGPMAQQFMEAYSYSRFLPGAGECPRHLFWEYEAALRSGSLFQMRRMVGVIGELLALAGGRAEDESREGLAVARFAKLAQNNFSDESLNIASLADMIGINRSTLSRLFKRHMQISPHNYINNLRINYASSLLRETQMPVARVAKSCGIPDPAYFAKIFKKSTGKTPLDFRKAKGAR